VAISSSLADPVPTRPALTVAVIGSARLTPPDPRCVLAEQTGAAIAAAGWTVMTGGYGGLMEVASRAAAEAGGTVIGLPMRGWSALTPNRWNHELRWSDTYAERLAHLLAADAIVVLIWLAGLSHDDVTSWWPWQRRCHIVVVRARGCGGSWRHFGLRGRNRHGLRFSGARDEPAADC
jgi:SLOG cluster4 family